MALSKPEYSVIVAAKRTPVGKMNGILKHFPSHVLGAHVVRDLLDSFPLLPERAYIGTMINAVAQKDGSVLMRQNPAKEVMIEDGCGWIDAQTENKACSSGLVVMRSAHEAILSGQATCVLAGGIESMSNFSQAIIDSVLRDVFANQMMHEQAEWCAKKYNISRPEQDDWVIKSFRRAQEAQRQGLFKNQIVPLAGFDCDEGPLRVVNEEKIRTLAPLVEGGTITAANACGNADGAAACLLVPNDEKLFQKYGIEPLARILGFASYNFGNEGKKFTIAQARAIRRLLAEAGLALADIDLFEIHTPFSVIGVYTIRELGLPPEKVNIHGDAIAVGHPVGATGTINTVKTAYALKEHGFRRAVVSTCNALGEAIAMLIGRYR